MNKLANKKKSSEFILYSNILLLSRNKLFYTKFLMADTFQNRINLIFFHISFIFIKVKQHKKNEIYNSFYQKLFDLLFKQIELNMRELGHGDVMVNKSMKLLVKSFYSILLFCENYKDEKEKIKKTYLNQYFKYNNQVNNEKNHNLIHYFNDFQNFCFDLTLDSVLKGELNFKFN